MTHDARIYLDNAATSFPKPPQVHEAMLRFTTHIGASPGRGAYRESREASRLLMQCRQRIVQLINGERPENVIFALNATDALNLAIRGVLEAAGQPAHAVTTYMDHNSVLRPLHALMERTALHVSRVRCDPATGLVDPNDIRKVITPDTKLVAVAHGSNVCGTLQPIRRIGAICRERDIVFLVDGAQTVGHVPVDVQSDLIDLLAFPGHKGLLGPLGTGGLYIRPGIETRMVTVREGGTGSASELDRQPQFMPDRFEPGSHNVVGIVGLSAAVKWILDQGVTHLWAHERELMSAMLDGLSELVDVHRLALQGPAGLENRCGVFCVRMEGFDDPRDLSNRLERRHGILTRPGLHCAPLAHKTLGTYDTGGGTRLSVGPFIRTHDVRVACDALAQIACPTVMA
ncbi:MAG: aminotransferase class V-fold PLP-dependent enzyme [Phycisphaeraceae bacterium]|jgi:cysteine desulfurase family protein|nr:aminotransferase class V-fold PLP-dependent enzyme [Phycisphaeraceae bacterium]MDP7346687.1 aminotransferase class V-fold PLP-dependent enzyme [Phycisphaeraceae bacterium]